MGFSKNNEQAFQQNIIHFFLILNPTTKSLIPSNLTKPQTCEELPHYLTHKTSQDC